MLSLYYSACRDLLSPAGVSEAFRRCCLGLEDAVTNILASIESGVIPAKEGSEMICRQRDSPVKLSSVCRVEVLRIMITGKYITTYLANFREP